MNEIWKPIPGYDDYYMASSTGKVLSLERTVRAPKGMGGTKTYPEAELKSYVDKYGYCCTSLNIDGRSKTKKVHRLVMSAFCGESLLHVNHIDGDKLNNNLYNLEYVTPRDNVRHSRRVLKQVIGEAVNTAILTRNQVIEIRENGAGLTIPELAMMYGVHVETIRHIIKRTSWTWL